MNDVLQKIEIFHDIFLVKSEKFNDERGYFLESYNKETFSSIGVSNNFVQDNLSFSLKAGTIRGLHFQKGSYGQAKLISVISGSILDIFVDIRDDSPNYGKYFSYKLKPETGSLLIPSGFAHGFCSLEDKVLVSYKVDNFYKKQSESGIIWSDPDLDIQWPLFKNFHISDKDKKLPYLKDLLK
tara:strand:- start:1328 stop:1876 length:549 start_codon:yes stop_codon:yes gene_type:complete